MCGPADGFGACAHEIDGGEAVFQIIGHPDSERRLALIDADKGRDARAHFLFGLISEHIAVYMRCLSEGCEFITRVS